MRTRIFIICLLIATTQLIRAQNKQERAMSHFTAVCVTAPIKVIVTVANMESLVLEGDEKQFADLKTDIKKNALFIDYKGSSHGEIKVVAYITVKDLNGIIAENASSIRMTNQLKTEHLNVTVSNASSVDLNIAGGELKAIGKDASTIKMAGTTKSFWLSLKSASSFKGETFACDETDAATNGASTAKINVTKSLKATASEASTIIYSGDPKDVSMDATGASTIRKG